jgi:parallel beta-helix repeat protein
MRKIIVVCIVYLLIIISFSGCMDEVSNIDVKTIYVDDDGGQDYTSIQDAIDSAEEGTIIYVYSGTYVEELHISKTIKLRGENKEKTIIKRPVDENGTSGDIIMIFADGVEISEFTIKNNKYIYSVGYGISILSNNNIISNNLFESADRDDINLDSSINNKILNNNFGSNGITISSTGSYFLKFYNTHTIQNNYVSGKPLYYYKNNHQDEVVEPDAGQVILVNCSNFTIKNLNLKDSFSGIQLYYSSHNNILKNTINNGKQYGSGIILFNSGYNKISNNEISFCSSGITINDFSNFNLINGNECNSNRNGIYHSRSTNNNIVNNTFLYSGFSGIYLDSFSFENTVSNNQILNNKWGIAMGISSDNNSISNNNIANSSRFGISIDSSKNNIFVNNNFINNSINARITDDKINMWDNGVEGNYWDNYTGIDGNGDGIGDTTYNIPTGGWYDEIPSIYNIDYYPLMDPIDIT